MRNRFPTPRSQHRGLKRSAAFLILGIVISAFLISEPTAPTSHAVVTLPAPPAVAAVPRVQRHIADTARPVRTEPSHDSAVIGYIGVNEPFDVFDSVPGAGCSEPGWFKTEGGGYVCSAGARPTQEHSLRLPRLVRFVHPDPSEWNQYLHTMRYDTNPSDKLDAMVPFIYAKRWKGWKGTNYASAASYAAGDPPLRRLGAGRKYHFVDAERTTRGTVLVRENGAVVPADDVHVYPLSKFEGWNLNEAPIPEGHLPAWAIDYDGTPVYASPSLNAPVGKRLDYHSTIIVEDEPVDAAGQWWMMPNGLGPGIPGFVNDQAGVRHWVPRPAVDGVRPGELWIDVDLGQQVLALRRGEDVEFVTLVSTGAPGTSTPRGVYAITKKAIWTDMASRPDSDDPYYVEKVPWVMHFKKRYALHGTFWHWGFGHRASHGCINLSVRDARTVFDLVSPRAYGGWTAALTTKETPGTVLRIRRDLAPVPDRRGG